MARTLYRLTDKIVRNLAAPGYHADGGGLYLQITKGGARSWVYRFAIRNRTRDMGLGPVRFVSLAEARAKATEGRALVAKGLDPIEQAKAEPKAASEPEPAKPVGKTFQEFAEEYIEARADTWRSDKHADQWRATLVAYAYPVIGDMPLDVIGTSDILRVLEPIWREKSETASRVRGRIERILAAASVRELRPATNPATWRGHLREALPRKAKPVPFVALPYAAIPAFMTSLRLRQGVGARALEFVILTAARSGEARGALWAEIDAAAREWTVPGARMKAGRTHIVPLSDPALAVLEGMKAMRDLAGGFAFPGLRPGRSLSDATLTKLIRTMGFADITVHGFRSSFRDWAGDKTEFHRDVAEFSLAHGITDKTEASYRRTTAIDKRRELMAAWGAYCMSTPVETVVPMQRALSAA